MSRYIATRAIRGANALVTEAEIMLDRALNEKVPETPVVSQTLHIIFHLTLGMTGMSVENLGQVKPVLNQARQLLHPVPSEKRLDSISW